MNRFDLKLNNGGEITEEDVRNLFSGVLKKNKVLNRVRDKRKEAGTDTMGNIPTLDDIAEEVLEIEAWEAKKTHK